jgi:PAS domain S-box-containing protein
MSGTQMSSEGSLDPLSRPFLGHEARLLDLAYDAIFTLRLSDSVITYWNRSAEDLYGWRAAEAIGQKSFELLSTIHDRPREEIVDELIRLGRWSGSMLQTRRDGTQMMVEGRWALDADDSGRPAAILEINRDVSELRTTLAQLEFSNQVSAHLSASLEPTTVLDRLLTLAVAAAQGSHATVARIEGDDAVVEASHDSQGLAIPVGLRWRMSIPAVMKAVRTGRPHMSGPGQLAHLSNELEPYLAGLDYRLNVPLAIGSDVIGLLIVGRREAAFGRDQQTAVERMATPAALALHNARLYEDAIHQKEAARKSEDHLKVALEQARQGELAKREFLNLAGHELRTPLTVIKGYFSLIESGHFGVTPEAWSRPLWAIGSELSTLEGLVESLVVAARADAEEMKPSMEHVNLADEVESAIRRAQARIELEGASCAFEKPAAPVVAVADPEHLARILDNLIRNALDYSPSPARVELNVIQGIEPMIIVRDTGIGIPSDAHERVFDRFVRLAPAVMATKAGSGLGLFISRTLARGMGGDVTVITSAPGDGTAMAVRLASPASGPATT